MDEDLKKKLLADINKNGYLQEMKVGAILEENSFYVAHNRFYADPETGKSREIDLFALDYLSAKELESNEINFRIVLVIEVKFSKDKPWVFFCKKNNYLRLDYFTPSTIRTKKLSHSSVNFYKNHPRYTIDYRANSYYEALRNKNDENAGAAYKAITGVCNATSYFTGLETGNIPGQPKKTDNDLTGKPEIAVFVPLVVFDGTLTRGYYVENEFILEETGYVTLDHTLFLQQQAAIHYPVDIVQFDYLGTYLDRLRTWAEETRTMINNNSKGQ